MGNKLYVGGLPYSVTDGRLQNVFIARNRGIGQRDIR